MYSFDSKQENDMKQLQADLEAQYGPAVAQDIIDQLNRANKGARRTAPDYMDVKAMSELQERFRAQAMMAVWKLKEWRRQHELTSPHTNLVVLEGAFLQRQCEEAIKLYRLANKNYHSMYREAMDAMIGHTSRATVFFAQGALA